MPHDKPRYEFRIFSPDLRPIACRLTDLADENPVTRKSKSIYLISLADDSHNVKIREGRLEIKKRIERKGILELWKPIMSLELPASLQEHRNVLWEAWGVEPVDLDFDQYGAREIIETLVGPRPELRAVECEKRRTQFPVGRALAEIVELSFDGHPLMSIALESEEADAVEQLRQRIDLDSGRYAAASYPDQARELLLA